MSHPGQVYQNAENGGYETAGLSRVEGSKGLRPLVLSNHTLGRVRERTPPGALLDRRKNKMKNKENQYARDARDAKSRRNTKAGTKREMRYVLAIRTD